MPTPPLKPKTLEQRPRDFLYPEEITAIIEAVRKHSRNPLRDSTLIMLMFCHSLQPVEVVSLTWQHINFAENVEPYLPTLTVYRNRHTISFNKPEKEPGSNSPFILICSELQEPYIEQHSYARESPNSPTDKAI